MVDRYLEGDGAPSIAKELNCRGIPGPTGNDWNVSAVRGTIFHPIHSGQVEVPGEGRLVRGAHWEERYYEPERYDRIMAEKQRRSRRRGTAPHSRYVLSGTLRCGLCGRNLVGAQSNNWARRYLCTRGGTHGIPECGGASVRADPLERVVVQAVLELADSPAIRANAEEAAERLLSERDGDLQREIDAAQGTIAEIERRRDRWTEAYTGGDISRERFRDHEQELVERQQRAEAHLEELHAELEDREAAVRRLERVRDALRDLQACWESLSYEQKRQLMHLAVEELTIEPDGSDVRVRLKLHFDETRELIIPAAAHHRVKPDSGLEALTLTELAILALLDEGLKPIEISRRRNVSRACTHTHLHNVRKKLDVETNEQAIEIARKRIAETRRFLPTEPVDDVTELTSKPALTEDQRAVLRLINDGLTYAEIGERLAKTEANVKYFAQALFQKFEVRDRRELALKARHMGMVPTPEEDRDQGE